MIPVEVAAEMYLKPTATGLWDWTTVTRTSSGSNVRRESGVRIKRGTEDLNDDPGPNRAWFTMNDPGGHFNIDNPMGDYFGSLDLGIQTRLLTTDVDDTCTGTSSNSWGSVGNTAGDTWTNGASSGGVVNNTDWTKGAGVVNHSIPSANAFRWSELSKATRTPMNAEIMQTDIKLPMTNITGGSIRREAWFRVIDVNNYHAASLRFNTDETLQIALFEKVAGVTRFMLDYTTISGITVGVSHVDFNFRAQIEERAMRAKVWESSLPEPLDWQVYASRAVEREGYLGVPTFVDTGNTNVFPIVISTDRITVRTPLAYGEVTKCQPSGDGKTAPMLSQIEIADTFDQLQTGSAPTKSAMRRGRTTPRRWLFLNSANATGTSTRVLTTVDTSATDVQVGDFFFLFNSIGVLKEETQFTIISKSVGGGTATIGFTPDARESIISGDTVDFYHPGLAAVAPVAYWPCEDGKTATQISSGLVGGSPMSITGSPNFAAFSEFVCSAPILQINDAELNANIPDYVDTNQAFSFTFLLAMPDTDEAASGTDLLQFYTTGTGWSYDLRYSTAGLGSLQLLVFNSTSTLLFDSGTIDFSMRGDLGMITLTLEQVGGAVNYRLFKTGVSGSAGGVGPAAVTGVGTLGKITQVRINPGGGYQNVAFGHITAVPGVWDAEATVADITGWLNQPALRRLIRLCYEESIPLTYRDEWDVHSARMGSQKIGRRADLFKDPAKTDAGMIYGPRGGPGLEFCTRGAMTNQTARVTLSVSGGQILPPFDPVRDYTNVHNQFTVNRIDGTSAVAEVTSGRLSTAAPPNGIGLRDDAADLSIGSDTLVQYHADWRLALNTISKHRAPSFKITAAGASKIGIDRLLSLNMGARIDITGMADKKIFDTMSQLVLGYTLEIGDRFYPELELHCAPYEPFSTFAFISNRYSRLDAVDTTTGSTLTTTATGALTLTSASGLYVWETDSGSFPMDIMIAGERITLSGISSASSPQTATISARSVNGVVKAHAVGETVSLAEPNYWQFR